MLWNTCICKLQNVFLCRHSNHISLVKDNCLLASERPHSCFDSQYCHMKAIAEPGSLLWKRKYCRILDCFSIIHVHLWSTIMAAHLLGPCDYVWLPLQPVCFISYSCSPAGSHLNDADILPIKTSQDASMCALSKEGTKGNRSVLRSKVVWTKVYWVPTLCPAPSSYLRKQTRFQKKMECVWG